MLSFHEQVLTRMGYRLLSGDNIWAKPIGYGIMVLNTSTKLFSFLFQDFSGTNQCWREENISESWANVDGSENSLSKFTQTLMCLENSCFRSFFYELKEGHDFSFGKPCELIDL